MTDKVELIRKEIESRIQECKDSKIDSSYYDGLIFAFEEVRDFINSLPEEPIAPKVLEDMLNAKSAAESLGISQEEHDRIVDELIYGKEPELVDVDDLPNKEEEPISDDLEEAMQHNAPDNIGIDDLLYWRNGFITGAKCQKEQMTKKAINAIIEADLDSHGADYGIQKIECTFGELEAKKFKNGARVKLVIVKED